MIDLTLERVLKDLRDGKTAVVPRSLVEKVLPEITKAGGELVDKGDYFLVTLASSPAKAG